MPSVVLGMSETLDILRDQSASKGPCRHRAMFPFQILAATDVATRVREAARLRCN